MTQAAGRLIRPDGAQCFDPPPLTGGPRNDRCTGVAILMTTLFTCFHLAAAQDEGWSITLSAAANLLQMGSVNETLDMTVADWNSNAIPIGPFPHFQSAVSYSARVVYRLDDQLGLTASVSTYGAKASDSYSDAQNYLSLDRSVGATDALVGVLYYLPPLVYRIDPYVLVEVGPVFARADGSTYQTQTVTNGGQTQTTVATNTLAAYRKTSGALGIGLGATMAVTDTWLLRGDLGYKFAKVGQMEGTLTRIAGTFEDTSTTDFDYSAFTISLGIGIAF